MRPIHVLLIAVVALGVGVVVGLGIGGGASDPGPGPVVPAAEGPRVVQDQPAADTTPRQVPPPRPAEQPGDAFDAWLNGLDGALPGGGGGRIFGRVQLQDGSPLAGVQITATPRWPETTKQSTDVRESVEQYARRVRFEQQGKAQTTTGAEGRYEFSGLGAYAFIIVASSERHELRASTNAYNVKPDAEINVTATQLTQIELDVRMPDGSQPESAGVRLVGPDKKNDRESWARSNGGVVNFKPGQWTMTVVAGEHDRYSSEPEELNAVLGERVPKRTIQLVARPCILVKLASHSHVQSRYGYEVHIKKDPPIAPPEATREGAAASRNISAGGEMSFPNLEAGRWRVVLVFGQTVVMWEDLVLGSGEFRTVELAMPDLKAEDHVVVRVFDPEGNVIPNASVSARLNGKSEDGSSSRGEGSQQVFNRPDGSYWIPRAKPSDDSMVWTYDIRVSTKQYGSMSTSYPLDATHEVEMRLQEPGSLTVILAGALTHPYKDKLNVDLWHSLGEGKGRSGIQAKGESQPSILRERGLKSDRFEYGPLTPGEYAFAITHRDEDDDYGHRNATVAEWKFEVHAGANTQTFSIPRPYRVTVVIPEDSIVRSMQLKHSDGSTERHISGVTDRVELDALTAGEWIIATDRGEMKLQVASDMEVKLEIVPFDCLIIGKLKTGGKIEAMGFRLGDKIVAIDGKEFEDLMIMQGIFMSSLSKESTTWTVLRNGARQDVQFNGRELMKLMESRGPDRERMEMRPGRRTE